MNNIIKYSNIKFFSDINEPIIYDTDKIGSKIICGRENSDIKCSLANFSFHHKNEPATPLGGRLLNNVNILFNYYEIIFYNISEINSTFSFNENNCNYARFISEYLICCGNLGVIICERREMNLLQVYFFNITLNGNIKNLIIENHNDSYLELLYYNETLESNNIYEYLIYPPKCKDINLELFNNGSSVINLDNLFERKTNTNYYISFDTSFSEDLIININTNNNSINNLREKIKLKLSDIKLYYDFKNIMQNNITINYNISIEETYSDSCTISIIFKNCYNSCKECSLSEEDSNPNSHNCIKCKENYYQFPNSSNCFTEEEIKINNFSYYFFDSNNKTFKECSPNCLTCNGPSENNCLSCRNESLLVYNGKCLEYQNEALITSANILESNKLDIEIKNSIPKINISENNGGIYISTTKIELPSYYSSSYIGINFYTPKNTSENDISTVKILSSISNIENSSTKTSIESCNENSFLTLNGDCVSICPNDTYGFPINNTCLKSCPNEYEINLEQKICIKKIEHTTSSEFKKQIENITAFINSVNSSKVINGSDFIALILSSNDMNTTAQIEKGISAIDLGNCTNVIKDYYNMTQNESFYVLNIESKRNKSEENNDNSFNLGKDVQIEIYDKSGNKLNLSICRQDIIIMKYIDDAEEFLNLNSAKSFSKQGIDVFNPKDDFFNDICKDFSNTNGKDIIINDRRKDIYQNATFCQNGCSYSGINYELMAANCNCNSSFLQISSDNNDTNNENKNNEEEIVTFKTLAKSIIENLFNFNSDVIKCYNLVFNKKIFYNNIGFYCMAIMFFLQIFFLFVFLVKRLKPLKSFMLKFNIYNKKTTNLFYPPKNKKNIKKRIFNFKEDNKHTIKNVLKNKKITLKNVGIDLNKNGSNSLNRLLSKEERKILQDKIMLGNKNKLHSIKSKKNLFNINMGNKYIKYYKKSKLFYNMKTIEEKNKIKNNLKINKDLIRLIKGDDNLQNLAYEKAILYDKRTFMRMYLSFLVGAQIILETFCKENYLTLFIIKLSFFICTFQINFFLNAFFYTDEYISNAYYNDGVLDFFSGLPKSIYSLIITMIITNLLNMLSNSKDKLVSVIRNKRGHNNYLHIVNIILKNYRNKLLAYFFVVFILGAIFIYYVTSFCSVYHYSQKYWFIGSLESFLMDFLIAIIICLFLALFRYLSIKKHIKCFYILANIISNFL